jgi:hypothetical protein
MSKRKLERCRCHNSPCPRDEFVEVNINKAAALCGIQRRTLLRRLEQKGYPLQPHTKHARLPLHIIPLSASVSRLVQVAREMRKEKERGQS